MLLVSGFRPIQRSYNNQTSNNANFRQSQFQSKADSVSFKSKGAQLIKQAELTQQAEKFMEELTQRILREYPNVTGANAKTKVLAPINAFLAEHGLSIKHQVVPSAEIRVHTIILNGGEVKNADYASLVDKRGLAIHDTGYGGYSHGQSAFGPTQNVASLSLFSKLIDGKMSLDRNNSLVGVQYPAELVAVTKEAAQAINDLFSTWIHRAPFDDADMTAGRYQKALQAIMPE